MLHWSVSGYLDVGVTSEPVTDFTDAVTNETLTLHGIFDACVQIKGMRRFENVGFCRSMFELYMGSDSIIPAAKEAWANGAKLLLESTKI